MAVDRPPETVRSVCVSPRRDGRRVRRDAASGVVSLVDGVTRNATFEPVTIDVELTAGDT